jgi:succinate-semialdehyde dehydrogenase / glutarate-semialdehyde dehydrogenase
MAGNAVVLKHASNVPGFALAIESVFREAGFPEHLFRTLLIPSRDVRTLIDAPAIATVTLTRSVAAGQQEAGTASAAHPTQHTTS